jgi:quercetin dioxygenase-like cupin family protein
MEGTLRISIAGEQHVLKPGDSLSFKSHLPHRWDNIGEGEAKVLWTLSPFTII